MLRRLKRVLLLNGLLFAQLVLAQKEQEKAPRFMPAKHWYASGELFSPFIYEDLYSWNDQVFYLGAGVQGKFGRQFSPVFALETNLGYGFNRVSASSYQNSYMLGIRDAYTYYPYTMINGTVYSPVQDLFGEQGKNRLNAAIDGISFRDFRSRIQYLQFSVNAVFNLNRLFIAKMDNNPQRWELLAKPGVYLSKFWSKVESRINDERVAPKVNKDLTFGLGGDLSVRYNFKYRWSLEFTNRLVWEFDRSLDGVLSAKRAYDAYIWSPGFGVVYKFGHQPEEPINPEEETPIIIPAKTAQIPFPAFVYSYPEATTEVKPKQRTHSATISLTYPLDKTYIVDDLMDNEKELNRLYTDIQKYLNDKDITIQRVLINGFASPEGPLAHNYELAVGRANSLIERIRSKVMIPRDALTIGTLDENWDGLLKALQEDTSIQNREAFLKVFEEVQNTEIRKEVLKQTPKYTELHETIYPKLRLSQYVVEYSVRGYSAIEAKDQIKNNPELLSPEEIYAVAYQYGMDSPEAKEAIEILNRLYPDSDPSYICRGLKAIENKQYTEAAELLEKVSIKNEIVRNALGVAYANASLVRKARHLFESAEENKQAKENLDKLEEYLLKTK